MFTNTEKFISYNLDHYLKLMQVNEVIMVN